MDAENWIRWFRRTSKAATHCAETQIRHDRFIPWARTSMQNRNCGGSGLRLLYDNDTPRMGPMIEGASPECTANHSDRWFQLEKSVTLSMRAYPEGMLLLAEMPSEILWKNLIIFHLLGCTWRGSSLGALLQSKIVSQRKDESHSGKEIRKKVCTV